MAKDTPKVAKKESKGASRSVEEGIVDRPDGAFARGAEQFVRNAYRKALAAGHALLIVEGQDLVRIDANGKRTKVGKVDAPVRIDKKATYRLK